MNPTEKPKEPKVKKINTPNGTQNGQNWLLDPLTNNVYEYKRPKGKLGDIIGVFNPVTKKVEIVPLPDDEYEDGEPVDVTKFTINGTTYLKSKENVLYLPADPTAVKHTEVGIWNSKTGVIDPLPDDDDEDDEDDDDEDDEPPIRLIKIKTADGKKWLLNVLNNDIYSYEDYKDLPAGEEIGDRIGYMDNITRLVKLDKDKVKVPPKVKIPKIKPPPKVKAKKVEKLPYPPEMEFTQKEEEFYKANTKEVNKSVNEWIKTYGVFADEIGHQGTVIIFNDKKFEEIVMKKVEQVEWDKGISDARPTTRKETIEYRLYIIKKDISGADEVAKKLLLKGVAKLIKKLPEAIELDKQDIELGEMGEEEKQTKQYLVLAEQQRLRDIENSKYKEDERLREVEHKRLREERLRQIELQKFELQSMEQEDIKPAIKPATKPATKPTTKPISDKRKILIEYNSIVGEHRQAKKDYQKAKEDLEEAKKSGHQVQIGMKTNAVDFFLQQSKELKIKAKKFQEANQINTETGTVAGTGLYSNPRVVYSKAEKYLGDKVQIKVSTKKDKKFMVFNPNTENWVHFGQQGYEDFTKHQDPIRQQSYLRRTANIKGDWIKDKYSPNNLSRNILW